MNFLSAMLTPDIMNKTANEGAVEVLREKLREAYETVMKSYNEWKEFMMARDVRERLTEYIEHQISDIVDNAMTRYDLWNLQIGDFDPKEIIKSAMDTFDGEVIN